MPLFVDFKSEKKTLSFKNTKYFLIFNFWVASWDTVRIYGGLLICNRCNVSAKRCIISRDWGTYAQYEILKGKICILSAHHLDITGSILIISYIKEQLKKREVQNSIILKKWFIFKFKNQIYFLSYYTSKVKLLKQFETYNV